MKFKKYSFLFVLVLFIVVLSYAAAQQEKMNVAQVRKSIEKANLKFGEAVRKGDAAALAALYTEDATLMPPNSEMIKGRQEIEEFWKTSMQMGVKDAILTTVDASGSGNLAYEIGKYTIKIQPEGQEPIEALGKYVAVWKLQADGSWKLHIDIWNSSMPPPQPPPPQP